MRDIIIKLARKNPEFRKACIQKLKEASSRERITIPVAVNTIIMIPCEIDIRNGAVSSISIPSVNDFSRSFAQGDAHVVNVEVPNTQEVQKVFERYLRSRKS